MSSVRRDSYGVWEKKHQATRLAPFLGTWITGDAAFRDTVSTAAPTTVRQASPQQQQQPLSSVRASSQARRPSYYEGFLGDVLSPEERAASTVVAGTANRGELVGSPYMGGESSNSRLSTSIDMRGGGGSVVANSQSRRKSSATARRRGLQSSLNNTAVKDDDEEEEVSLDSQYRSTNGVTPLLPQSCSTRGESTTSRRRTSAAVVDPLSRNGTDTAEARVRKSAFDAQLVEAMVNTAHRMSVAEVTSPTNRRASASVLKAARRVSEGSSANGLSGVLNGSGSGAVALPVLGSPLMASHSSTSRVSLAPHRDAPLVMDVSTSTAVSAAPGSVTRRITFSPMVPQNTSNNSTAMVPVSETIGWGTQSWLSSPPEPEPTALTVVSTPAASRTRPRPPAQRPSSSASHTQRLSHSSRALSTTTTPVGASTTGLALDAPVSWAATAPPPPAEAPQLSHKQLTEAFYGRYKGGVMAKDAYLYFLAAQAEEKHQRRRTRQLKKAQAVAVRVQGEPAPCPANGYHALDTDAGAVVRQESSAVFARDPSAAFDVLGMPVSEMAAAAASTSIPEALRARLRSMSIQSNQNGGVSQPISQTNRERGVAASVDSADSGYYQFRCVNGQPCADRGGEEEEERAEPAKVTLSQTTGTMLNGSPQESRCQRASPSRVGDTTATTTPALPAHLQALLRRSQAVYDAKQVSQ